MDEDGAILCPGPPSCAWCDGKGGINSEIALAEVRPVTARGYGEPPPRVLSKDMSFGQVYERTEYERMRESMRREIEYEVRLRLEQEMRGMMRPAYSPTEAEMEELKTPEAESSPQTNPKNRKLMLD